MSELEIGPVMVFSGKRAEIARFYRDVVGLAGEEGAHATWLDAENAKLALHDRGDRRTPAEISSSGGFVVWFGVADVRAAYDRARQAGATSSDFFGDYFFARDPDGRYVGIYALEGRHGHDHEH
ncbi:MAG TPA: VOC family protein [Candidatus Limnocylindria bacterium]|nr:VOC family protein [Candidatus Limnocylindria bacterium]